MITPPQGVYFEIYNSFKELEYSSRFPVTAPTAR